MTKVSRSTSSPSDMRPVWMLKICLLVLMSGSGNSIFRSMRPGRIRAGSKLSISFVEPVELIQQFEHRPLDLPRPARLRIIALRTDRVDLVDKHDRGRQIVRDSKKLPHELRAISEVLLD